MGVGHNRKSNLREKEKVKLVVKCDDVGEMKEYIGCKVHLDAERRALKLTQPVLVQSFSDEFELLDKVFDSPAAPGTTLQKTLSDDNVVDKAEQAEYQTGAFDALVALRHHERGARVISVHGGSEQGAEQSAEARYEVSWGHS